MKNNMKTTDWDNVAQWYDTYLQGEDTYQQKVIAPNLLRMLDIKIGDRVLDVACGQGYFAAQCARAGATVIGVDQSAALIALARHHESKAEQYVVGDAQKLGALGLKPVDMAFTVLAFENIKNIAAVLEGVYNVLKKQGRVVIVMLHPAFRIPKASDWNFNTKTGTQSRTVEKYLSEIAIPIELNPFQGGPKEITYTFHRSLQWYMKACKKAGFVLTSLEEWISHKKSEAGPRQAAEDSARKEIPMFLAIELRKS